MPLGERLLMGLFLAFSVAATVLTLGFKQPEARSFPLIVGAATSLLIVAYFVIRRSAKLSTRFRAFIVDDLFVKIDAGAGGAAEIPDRAVLHRERMLIALLAGFVLLAWIVGLTIAVPAFLVFTMRGFAGESWRTSLIVSGGTCFFLYVVFVEILRLKLHFGLMGGL